MNFMEIGIKGMSNYSISLVNERIVNARTVDGLMRKINIHLSLLAWILFSFQIL
jgi:hypothetical protein